MKIAASSFTTLINIRDLRDALMEGIAAGGGVELDLAAVEEADISLPQLLVAFRNTAAAAGQQVRLCAPAPAPVVALLERAGFLAALSAADLDFWFHGERQQ